MDNEFMWYLIQEYSLEELENIDKKDLSLSEAWEEFTSWIECAHLAEIGLDRAIKYIKIRDKEREKK